MKATAYFQSEHQAILSIVDRLTKTLASGKRDEAQVEQVLRRVSNLRMAILLHVVVEDGDFYPRIARCGHPKLQQPIQQIKKEAGDIDLQFGLYLSRWTVKRGVQNYDRLSQEARGLLDLLGKRITVEEQIFAMIEELGVDMEGLSSNA